MLFRRLDPLPACAAALLLVACGSEKEEKTATAKSDYSPYHDIPEATYVGRKNCRSCHQEQFSDWLQSDHHKAMNPATEEFVLGDFDDVTFEHHGQTFRFFRKGDEYWVNAPGPDGEPRDMQIEYTFGHEPLQQYLIAFPGGRYQALQVCWDSRPAEEGGQRWYHLYPDEPVPPEDVLHWTRRHFNWNYMCADCHSTNLDKNFDTEDLSYHTTWSDRNVGCEACHGPGSEHLKWAKDAAGENGETGEAGAESPADSTNGGPGGEHVEKMAETDPDFDALNEYLDSKGLVVTLKEPGEPAAWEIDPETGLPKRTKPLASDVQVQTCARCHAHRQLMEPVYEAGQPLYDTHVPSVLTDRLYHHDGQIDEEVYVYGSFHQSDMYHAGVRCTDCHDPHTNELRARGNALCLRCHQADPYNTPAHHQHPVDSTGARCVECHMPEKNYMVVDARRDHSMRVPHPGVAAEIGAPDACTKCHTEETQEWAAERYDQWWGTGPRNAHYGEILAAARQGAPGSLDRLAALAADDDQPGIVRASALETLGRRAPPSEIADTVTGRLDDPDPAVRLQALGALSNLPAQQRPDLAAPLLEDPRQSVRAEAARVLAPSRNQLTERQRAAFARAADEFRAKQRAVSDRAAGHMAMGLFHADLGNPEKAEAAYRTAQRVQPEFVPARVNLAEMLFERNRPEAAERAFREAVDAAMTEDDEGIARDALARFLIRLKRYEEGVEQLRRAAELRPEHAPTQYFYGVALNSRGRFDEALPYLEKANSLAPNDVEYLVGLATICRDAGRTDLARRYADDALALQPENRQLQRLVQSLQ